MAMCAAIGLKCPDCGPIKIVARLKQMPEGETETAALREFLLHLHRQFQHSEKPLATAVQER
jgi:hypothetical protein